MMAAVECRAIRAQARDYNLEDNLRCFARAWRIAQEFIKKTPACRLAEVKNIDSSVPLAGPCGKCFQAWKFLSVWPRGETNAC